jgi:predicted transcriptional regulator
MLATGEARALREHARLSLADAANALGLSHAALSRYENGIVTPGLEWCKRLGEFYGDLLKHLDTETADREPAEVA